MTPLEAFPFRLRVGQLCAWALLSDAERRRSMRSTASQWCAVRAVLRRERWRQGERQRARGGGSVFQPPKPMHSLPGCRQAGIPTSRGFAAQRSAAVVPGPFPS